GRVGRSLALPPLRDREVVGEDEEAAADDHDEAADGEVVECHSGLHTARVPRVRSMERVTVTPGNAPASVAMTSVAAPTATAAGHGWPSSAARRSCAAARRRRARSRL